MSSSRTRSDDNNDLGRPDRVGPRRRPGAGWLRLPTLRADAVGVELVDDALRDGLVVFAATQDADEQEWAEVFGATHLGPGSIPAWMSPR